jgi:hypothetical protein
MKFDIKIVKSMPEQQEGHGTSHPVACFGRKLILSSKRF